MENRNLNSEGSFSLGFVPYEEPWQKRQRILRERQLAFLEKKRKAAAKKPKSILQKKAIWRIYPDSLISNIGVQLMVDGLSGNTYTKKIEELHNLKKQFSLNPLLKKQNIPLYKEAIAIVIINQQLRYKFKRLILLWKLSKLRIANDVDPITLAPPDKIVSITSIKNGVKYVFDAASIAKDFHKKLLHSRLQIPQPLFPRNPLTNQEFTFAEMFSLWKQCKAAGETYWTIEAFRELSFDTGKFLLEYNRKLRLNAVESVLNDSDSDDFFDMLMDFITEQHEMNAYFFNEDIYEWCIDNVPNNPLLQTWRNLCKRWYKCDILIDDDVNKYRVFNKIMKESKLLCEQVRDLFIARIQNIN